MEQRPEGQGVEADGEVARDAHQDQGHGPILLAELGEDQGAHPGHHLGGQQEHHLAHGGQAQIGADVDAVVDDGAHAVDIEEESDEEEEDLLVPDGDLFQGGEDLLEHLAHGGVGVLHVVLLLIVFDEGQGDQQPPDGGDPKADDLAHHGREEHQALGQAAAEDIGHHSDEEGNAGADVAPGVAVGGDLVHALLGGHVVEHGIIEGQGRLVEHLGQHVDDEEEHPAPGEAVEDAADDAGGHGGLEEDLLRLLPIGKSP